MLQHGQLCDKIAKLEQRVAELEGQIALAVKSPLPTPTDLSWDVDMPASVEGDEQPKKRRGRPPKAAVTE